MTTPRVLHIKLHGNYVIPTSTENGFVNSSMSPFVLVTYQYSLFRDFVYFLCKLVSAFVDICWKDCCHEIHNRFVDVSVNVELVYETN